MKSSDGLVVVLGLSSLRLPCFFLCYLKSLLMLMMLFMFLMLMLKMLFMF